MLLKKRNLKSGGILQRRMGINYLYSASTEPHVCLRLATSTVAAYSQKSLCINLAVHSSTVYKTENAQDHSCVSSMYILLWVISEKGIKHFEVMPRISFNAAFQMN